MSSSLKLFVLFGYLQWLFHSGERVVASGPLVIMPPTSKKLEEHITSGMFVRASDRLFIRPFEKRDILYYGVWRPSVCKLFPFRLTPPTVYIRSS